MFPERLRIPLTHDDVVLGELVEPVEVGATENEGVWGETARPAANPESPPDGSDSASKWAAGPSSQLRWQWWGGPEEPASKKREPEPDVPSTEGE